MSTIHRPPSSGVVFDLDGVLVLSEHLWEEAWEDYARRYRYLWSAEDTRRCQGMSVREWAHYLADRTSHEPADAADDVVDRVATAYEAGHVELAPGAWDVVATAAARVPVGLASSAPRRIIDVALRTTGIGRSFQATVSSAEVPRGKPSPDVYIAAVRALGVDAKRSVAVEDSSNGVRAAHAAGLTVIALPHDRYPLAPDAAAMAHAIEGSLEGVAARLTGFLDRVASGVGP